MQAKKRIKEFLPEPQTVSGVTALAKPRRIKASHRRRRKVASDHLLYILNNPLSGTDPTGYCAEPELGTKIPKCNETLTETHKNAAGEVIGSKTQRVPNGTIAALTGGQQSRNSGAQNGARSGASTTSEKREESKSAGLQALSMLGNAAKRGIFGPIIDYGERGSPGEIEDHALNGAKWAANTLMDMLDLVGVRASGNPLYAPNTPRFEYSDEGLKTPAVLQGVFLLAPFKGMSAGKLNGAMALRNAEAGSIRYINPTLSKQNCANCAIALDATLAGRPASALPGRPTSSSVLEAHFGQRFGALTSIDSITRSMAGAGNGARGIVFGYRGPGRIGHVFNVINQRGVVRYLDGQAGKPANLNDSYESFSLMRTN